MTVMSKRDASSRSAVRSAFSSVPPTCIVLTTKATRMRFPFPASPRMCAGVRAVRRAGACPVGVCVRTVMRPPPAAWFP